MVLQRWGSEFQVNTSTTGTQTSPSVAMDEAARSFALDHTLERNCREILDVYQEVVARRLTRAA